MRLLRTLIVGGLMAATVAVGSVAIAGPAGAATSGSCLKLSGNVNTTVTVSECTPEPGPKAKLLISSAALTAAESSVPMPIAWAWSDHGSGTITSFSSGFSYVGYGGCSGKDFDRWDFDLGVPDDSTGVIDPGPAGLLWVPMCVNDSTGAVKTLPKRHFPNSIFWASV